MANQTITIPVDAQTAKAYDAAAPEERRKMQALASLWLRELAAKEPASLRLVLDKWDRRRKRGA